jgi:hypothetical protein
MDALDFDNLAQALSRAADSTYQVHFLGTIEDAEEYGEPDDICYAASAAEFPDTLSWTSRRAQPFENTDIPRVLFVDPEGVLLKDPQAYALNLEDYEALFAKFKNTHTLLLDTGW